MSYDSDVGSPVLGLPFVRRAAGEIISMWAEPPELRAVRARRRILVIRMAAIMIRQIRR